MTRYVLIPLFLLPIPLWAGNLEPPAAPDDISSAMYSLEDICNRLDSGTEATPTPFTEPATGPNSTGCNLNDIMKKAPQKDNANGVTPKEVLADKKYWGLTNDWGLQTGTMPNHGAQTYTPKKTNQSIDDGYHEGSVIKGDDNLISSNIKKDITIFGVNGDQNVVDTSSGDAVAEDILKEKTAWVDGNEVVGTRAPAPVPKTGEGGSSGVDWPNPRFDDHGDGTVTDNLTGLRWLKDAGCLGLKSWDDAQTAIGDLNGGTDFSCVDYTPGAYSDWRLPTMKELQSLVHYGTYTPAISNTNGTGKWTNGDAFLNIKFEGAPYWSATTTAKSNDNAWYVHFNFGVIGSFPKGTTLYVWSVRGGS